MVQLIESLSKKEISAFFNIIYKNSIDSLLLLDENGLILNCNAAAEKLFNITENDMINKNCLDIIIPPSKIYILNERQSLPSEIFETQTEFSLIRKDQTLIWVRVRISKINNNNNNLFLLTCRDITKEKETKFKLREVKEKDTKFVQFFRDIINKKEVNKEAILDIVNLLPKEYELDNDALKKFDEIKNSAKEHEEYKLIEELINKKLKFEKLLSSISSRFIGNLEFDNAIHTTLRDIGELIDISRVFIFLFNEERQTMSNTHEWCAKNIKPHINFYKDFPLDSTPWAMSHILAGKPLIIPDVSKLPQEATNFRNLLISKDIKANLTLPIYVGGKITGFIGFDDEKNVREWLDEDFSLLQISSQILGNAFERKNNEEILKLSEKKYRNLFENSPMSIILLDKQGYIVDTNPANYYIFGYSKKELVNQNFKSILNDLITNNFLPSVMDFYEKLIKGEIPESREVKTNKKDGRSIWINLQASFVRLGNQTLIQLISQDIDKIKKAEQKLIESEEKYRNITEQSLIGIIIIQDDLIKYVNDKLANLVGFSREQLMDLKKNEYLNLVHKEDRLFVSKQAKIKQKGQDNGLNHYTFRLVRKDRKIKWVEVFAKTIIFDGRYADLGTFIDITEKVEAEQKIKESESKYRSILESIKEGYFEVDLKGNFIFFNDAVCESFGCAREELIGSNYDKYMDKKNLRKVFDFYNNVYKTGIGQTGLRFEIINKSGEKLYVEGSVYLKLDSKGNKVGFYGISRDITEKVKMEKLEIEFREKLEKEVNIRTKELKEVLDKQNLYLDQIIKASNFKTEFLASMSHELRTPLNAIIGFTELLLEGVYGDLNQEQLEFVSDIEESSKHLLDMIIRILDISKIESGQVNLKIEKIELKLLIDQIFSTIKPLINEKDIQINYNRISSKQIINADRIKFKQILYNLLSNAIKFTIEGQVTLTFIDKKDYWEFNVRDTGIGIADEDYDLIFKDFKRIKSPFIEKIPGSGLGLALTRRIVHLHEGDISFKSKLGKGTTFTFTIPKEYKKKNDNLSVQDFLRTLK